MTHAASNSWLHRKTTDLGEQRVQAMKLLLFIHKRIILRHTLQCQLIHQVDLVRALHPLVAEFLDSDGEGGTDPNKKIK